MNAQALNRALFTTTIFLGSFLLFLVQPLIARLVLPRLGGAPAVWNTAMLFFQATLLAGYLYAHALDRLKLRWQLGIHIALFAAAGLMLPLGLANWGAPPTSGDPAFWLLGLLTASIGPLFLVMSAQSPLMQAWYARSGGSPDPYFLYAASNAGNLLALLAYPTLVEPTLRLGTQSLIWSGGFALLAVLAALCGLRVLRAPPVAVVDDTPAPPIKPRDALRWTALAAVPSGLLISTTTHLTTDITAIPLLWVLPLAIYLVTFIIAFSDRGKPIVAHAVRFAAPMLLVLGSYAFLASGKVAFLMATANLVLLFYLALALHGRLAASRPAASRLTAFYFFISLGGMLGGLFCALIAPLVFDWGYEHPILLVAAALLLPSAPLLSRLPRPLMAMRVLGIASVALSWWVGVRLAADPTAGLAMAGLITLVLLAVAAIGRPMHFAGQFLLVMMALGGWLSLHVSSIPDARSRSFFGIYTVEGNPGRGARELLHGTTLHGVQSQLPQLRRVPTTYYAYDSGVGRVFANAPSDARIGFVGLGIGTLTCYAKHGQDWTAFEIDPAVVRIARNPRLFTYIQDCKPDLRIELGDARLTLARQPAARFDLLALDAFSSDAIPLHLITSEAFRAYGRVLTKDGVLMVHITNRFLDLEPVVAAIADEQGWTARVYRYQPSHMPAALYASKSWWVALSRDPRRMNTLVTTSGDPGGWRPLRHRKGLQPWTDDFSAVLPVFSFD